VTNDLAARARELALTLTSWPSVTGTRDEAEFARKLADDLTGFDQVWLAPVPDDPAGRNNVFALKRGTNRETIILTGHFDVVPIDNYGDLEHLAFDPERLLPYLIARLKRSNESALALADFESGAFLPGRGLLDMKAGLAAGIAAIEAYRGSANLLFMAVCDEEERSAGARAAVPLLPKIAEEHGLDIQLIINLDAISDQGDGSLGRVVAIGSIGKQLLTAFVVAKETHACFPQDGINAAYLAAELVTEFELAADLGETTGTEIAAAPTALHAKDLKLGYNVTTPGQAWVYWNTLQHRRSAREVLDISVKLAKRAMDRAAAKLNRDVPVLTYAELATRAAQVDIAAMATEIARQQEFDFPERSKRLTAAVWQHSGLTGPAIVLGFGSIPYPAVSLKAMALRQSISSLLAPFEIGTVRYFTGISDMSFLGEPAGESDPANTPLAGSSFAIPQPAGYPCINLGPWGRDYHHWLERLHAPYAFEVLPRALLAVIEATIDDAGQRA
jgi:arginine utilization protein RocB